MGITRRRFGTGAAAALALTAARGVCSVSLPATSTTVETSHGLVSGGVDSEVRYFLGIPYGADTGGANRFLPPNPPEPWKGTLDATRFGSSAPQSNPDAQPVNSPLMGLFPRDPDYVEESEDCLRLNVWTPAGGGGAKPVLVWLHGGGFFVGSASWPVYNGANFARTNDAVVVSVNHRLNAFGYCYLAEALGEHYGTSGNAGMLDIVAALRWVSENIAAFGGDPDNVTIRGQSGGGAKVSTLLAMPAARGLFHKAIIESGPMLRAREPAEATTATGQLIEALGGRDKLLTASRQDLLRAYYTVRESRGRGGFSPVVDGEALPRHPYDPDATSLSAGVPLLIGRTHHERATFMLGRDFPDQGSLLEAVEDAAAEGEAADLVASYHDAYPRASLKELAVLILTDSSTGLRTRVLADRKSTQPAPVYAYRFDWETKIMDGAFRATHGMDTSFIFNNTAIDPLVGGDPTAAPLAERVCRSWGAFMRTGSPQAENGLGPWPKYTAENRQTMLINNTSRVERDPDGGLMDRFELSYR